MTRDNLLNVNAGITKGIVWTCTKSCPETIVLMSADRVNSVMLAMCELYKKKGLDFKKMTGVPKVLDLGELNGHETTSDRTRGACEHKCRPNAIHCFVNTFPPHLWLGPSRV